MNQTVSLASKLEKSRCRGKLLAALEGKDIITSITLGENAQFILHTATWDDYRKDVRNTSRKASELIDRLHDAGTIGFITPMSDHFCESCDRVRLMAGGALKSCFFHPPMANRRDAMRAGAWDGELAREIRSAVRMFIVGGAGFFARA